ncbi:hypothetical protein JKF63_04510 [Porcisia hertigi]|uniref:Uncharacterized protein n=1 Tax=Porcisia hertigi TaxID=2761500 RepID=A0A836IKE9_9TRYP|nr:hypothetical protein JKF63_04510 [Porcisia hertigi]
MDSTDAVTTAVWALSASPAEGVAALELIAQKYEWLSTLPLDDLLKHVGSHPGRVTDAREMMSCLLSVSMPLPSAAQAALYLLIVSRVYVALFLETVGRKRRLLRHGEHDALPESEGDALFASVFTTMEAWARDLISLLVLSVLPSLFLRDAEPTTVRASHTLTHPPEAPSMGSGCEAGASCMEREVDLPKILDAYCARRALVRLVDAIQHTTRSMDGTAASFLLATYAALCHAEPCPSWTEHRKRFPGANISPSQPCRERVLPETNAAASSDVPAEGVPSCDARVDGDLGGSLTGCLARLREIATESNLCNSKDPLSFALASLQGFGFSVSRACTLHPTDVERGTAPPDSTAASLAVEHDRDIEAYTLVALDALDERTCDVSGETSEEVFSASLCRQGALLLLADALRPQLKAAYQPPFVYSVSATSLLFGVIDAYIVALRDMCSGAVLMRHLFFLHDLLSAIPKYTARCAEDAGSNQSWLGGQRGLDSCLTRRYQGLFDIARELLIISATCPIEDHRVLARIVALELLERLEERARVRMHGSLMALCPYPSIARFFLEEFLSEWRSTKGTCEVFGPDKITPMHTQMPVVLQECVQTFITHVSHGTSGFVDPLVVALNFVRVAVSQEEWIRSLCTPAGRSAVNNKDAPVHRGWCHLLRTLRETLLPRCHALMKNVAAKPEGQQTLAFSVEVSLSPLDLFSLRCAVEGLEEVLR